ncbi:MAG TPA: tRNA pseudouridine(55) synthase TruB, partial [Casimicrobiaceae bacterium]|nr:tRNA pseudouridine(55) synthase TruB [Casimicrobiaceae bacterium]
MRGSRSAPFLRRRVNGVLLLDKPVGLSSNAALQQAKRRF